jgi:hypothetical protein
MWRFLINHLHTEDDKVGILANFDGANAFIHADELGWVDCPQFDSLR